MKEAICNQKSKVSLTAGLSRSAMQQSIQPTAVSGRVVSGWVAPRCSGVRSFLTRKDTQLFRSRSAPQTLRSRQHRLSVQAMAAVKTVDGPEGLQKVVLQGASELMFLSKKAVYKPPKAIRGGVPLCFPQFGPGSLGQHGFARNSMFEVSEGSSDSVTLSLRPTPEQLEKFGHPFHLQIKVQLGADSLTQTIEVLNEGQDAMPLTTAFHTYFLVSDVDSVHVDMGKSGLTYLDNTKGKAESRLSGNIVKFQGENDAIFVGAPDTLTIVDEKAGRKISIKKENLPDAVVWNPWADKANAMADMGEGEYRTFVCVEPALAASGPVHIEPGKSWKGIQVLSVA